MKKVLVLFIIFLIFFQKESLLSQVCGGLFPPPSSTGINPYIAPDNINSIEPYLARSIVMEGFQDYFTNNPSACDNYYSDIKMLADLNVSWIQNLTYYYGPEYDWAFSDSDPTARNTESCFNVEKDYIKSYRQVVKDINSAYDQKGQRRPIIDAFVPENIYSKYSTIDGANSCTGGYVVKVTPFRPIEKVPIPKLVIQYFYNLMTTNERNYYFINGSQTNPRTDLKFKFDSVTYANSQFGYSPDMSKIEGSMWIFFICKQFIDRGFTSINLSQINFFYQHSKSWNNIDPSDNYLTQTEKEQKINCSGGFLGAFQTCYQKYYDTDTYKAYYYITKTLEAVRSYAKSQNTFLLIWTQSDRVYYAYDLNNGVYQKRIPLTYIFDVNDAAMKPRGVDDSHLNDGRNILPASQVPLTVSNFNTLMPDCANSCIKATIDPGSGINYERSGPGNSPTPWWKSNDASTLINGKFFNKQPIKVRFDGADGRFNQQAGCYNWSNGHVWGYDESRWWSEFIKNTSDLCAGEWLQYQYKNVRTFDYSSNLAYLSLPGRVLNRTDSALDVNLNTFLPFRLSEHPGILAAVKDIWTVNEINSNSINVYFNASNGYNLGTCTSFFAGHSCPGNATYGTYSFSVNNPDKSSIYSWHIQWSDGTWEQFTYGTSRTFAPTRSGSFTLTLRQDNLGLNSATYIYGSKGISLSPIAVNSQCIINYSSCFGYHLAIKPSSKKPSNNYLPIFGAVQISENEVKNLSNNIVEIKELPNSKDMNYTIDKVFNAQVFPQPASDKLNLNYSIPESGKLTIELYSPIGSKVMEITSNKDAGEYMEIINLNNLSNGFYLLKISCNDWTETLKVTKM